MKRLAVLLAFLCVAAKPLATSPSLGIAEGRCRAGEPGPAFMITATGLKDRSGTMKVELYPANDADFLQDDNILLNAGKTFRRVVVDVPSSGPVQLCIRAPAAGTYALTMLHDRDSNRKFGLSVDGVGFGSNPARLGPSKPKLAVARASVGNGVSPLNIRMMYRRGLFSFGPIR